MKSKLNLKKLAMSEFKFDIPNSKHKFVILAENKEKAKERYDAHFGIKDDNQIKLLIFVAESSGSINLLLQSL